nr:tRNA pseudouridine(38/39) synthase isoform X1 [Ipomoea batatas]
MNGTAVCDTTATSSCEMDLSEALQSEIQYLRNKVKELESQNAKLSALLSNCHCQQLRVQREMVLLALWRAEAWLKKWGV